MQILGCDGTCAIAAIQNKDEDEDESNKEGDDGVDNPYNRTGVCRERCGLDEVLRHAPVIHVCKHKTITRRQTRAKEMNGESKDTYTLCNGNQTRRDGGIDHDI